MASQSVLVLGATGAVGKCVLKELLSSPHYTRVVECGRKVTPIDQIVTGKEKLEQKVIDFEKLEDAGLSASKCDVILITLGTSKANAGSAAAFEKIDREYVINAARAAKAKDASHAQRLVYLSSSGANPSSSTLYLKSKGLTEVGLASLGYSDTIIFRPGVLRGAARSERRIMEDIAGSVTGILSHILPDKLEIQVSSLAKSIVLAGRLGSSALPPVAEATKGGSAENPFTIIANKGAAALAKTAV